MPVLVNSSFTDSSSKLWLSFRLLLLLFADTCLFLIFFYQAINCLLTQFLVFLLLLRFSLSISSLFSCLVGTQVFFLFNLSFFKSYMELTLLCFLLVKFMFLAKSYSVSLELTIFKSVFSVATLLENPAVKALFTLNNLTGLKGVFNSMLSSSGTTQYLLIILIFF